MTTKRKRPQSPKSRSLATRDMLLDPRGGFRGRVPSGTTYKRDKSFSRVDTARYSD